MNPMCALRLAGRKLRRLAGVAALGLLAVGGMAVTAQEPEGDASTNDVVSAEVLARLTEMMQSVESAPLEDFDTTEATNAAPSVAAGASEDSGRPASSNRFQNPSRSQNEDGRSRSRRSSRPRSSKSSGQGSATDSARGSERSPGAGAGANSGPAGLDYAAFKMIVDRNIFDPNRFPRRTGTSIVRTPPTRVDSLTLVGTMSYEKGTFAFFDGTSSDYKKALKLSDVIAGYRVTNIVPDSVTLSTGTNELKLRVGMQLRREENGPWLLASRSGSYTAVPASPATNAAAASAPGSDPASSAAESEIIKKLMQRRAQE
jgi:hypothetical protein